MVENGCDSAGPRLKLRKASWGAGSVEQVSQFTQAGEQLNLQRNADATLRPTASGIMCRGLFCDTSRRRRFPPTEEGILAWSSIFASGRTFVINVRHPEEARLLLGLKTNLTAGAVATVADGLPMPSGQRYIPRPAVSEQQLVGPMLSKGWGEELAILAATALYRRGVSRPQDRGRGKSRSPRNAWTGAPSYA